MTHHAICPRCQRPILFPVTTHTGPCDIGITAYVVHEFKGCDTGCCGHRTFLVDAREDIVANQFHFNHPDDETPLGLETYIRDIIHRDWPWAIIDYGQCHVSTD